MGDRAEFGPLDVQMHKPDEFMQRISGLDITKALAAISDSAWESFQDFFIQVRAGSGGVITTKTASEIAAHVVTGLYSPITQNIDPLKLGEMQRSMDIAVDYGMRLGASRQLATTLASTYPTHGFVIDYEESHRIFDCVRVPTPEEMQLGLQLAAFFQANISEDVVRHPSPEGVIAYLNPSNLPTPTNENNCTGTDGDNATPASQHPNGIPSDSGNDDKPKRSRRAKATEIQEADQDGSGQPPTRS